MDEAGFAGARPRRSHGWIGALRDDVARSPLTYTLLGAGIALQLLLVALHGINKELLGDGTLLALDRDANVPSWITTALYVTAGLACWLLAWARPAGRVALVLLGLIAFGLSFEQMAQLHGDLERDGGDAVMLVVQPLLAIGFVAVVVAVARSLPRRSRALLVAMVLAIATAQGSSMLNSEFDLPYPAVIVLQTLEEVAEMMTAIFLIAALAQPLADADSERVLRDRDRALAGADL